MYHDEIIYKMKIFIQCTLLFFICNLSNAQVLKLGQKTFFEKAISKKNYTIESMEKAIMDDDIYYRQLLNKAARFNAFMYGQNLASKLYSKNCMIYATQIAILNERTKIAYENGQKNADYLLEIVKKTNPKEYEEHVTSMKSWKTNFGAYLTFTDSDCYGALLDIKNRKEGVFAENKMGNNLLSFNNLLHPENELRDNHSQEFSSLYNAPEENFFISFALPKSWFSKAKKDFKFPTTVGLFIPFESFLNANIVASILPNMISEDTMKSEDISDNDLVDMIYEDDEILISLIKYFTGKINSNNIISTIYNMGSHKMIFYNSSIDNIGEVMGNDMLENRRFEILGALYVKNGKVISVSGNAGGVVGFNSYDYHSKLFFKVLTSVKFKDIKKNVIYLTEEQNMKFIQLNFNGLKYKFMLDTGASNIVINQKIFTDLMSNGIINKGNYVGESFAEIADGSIISCRNWVIPEITIGAETIKNVTVSVTDSQNSMPLFGMDGLNKLNVTKLNLKNNEIILNRE